MAIKSSIIELTDSWQELIDNSGTNSDAENHMYVNSGSGIFRFDTDTPDDTENWGMRISAGARYTYVPTGTKLYGKRNVINDKCIVILNINS